MFEFNIVLEITSMIYLHVWIWRVRSLTLTPNQSSSGWKSTQPVAQSLLRRKHQVRGSHHKLHWPSRRSGGPHAFCRSCRHRSSLHSWFLLGWQYTLQATHLCGECNTQTCTAGRGSSIGRWSLHRRWYQNRKLFLLSMGLLLISSQRILEILHLQYHHLTLCTDGSTYQILPHLICILYMRLN